MPVQWENGPRAVGDAAHGAGQQVQRCHYVELKCFTANCVGLSPAVCLCSEGTALVLQMETVVLADTAAGGFPSSGRESPTQDFIILSICQFSHISDQVQNPTRGSVKRHLVKTRSVLCWHSPGHSGGGKAASRTDMSLTELLHGL